MLPKVLFFLLATTLEAGEKTTILITHPVADELVNIERLAEKGFLQIKGLRLVGVYHREEWEDYSASLSFCAERNWLELRRLDCQIEAKDVFTRNDCSDEFAELFRESAGAVFTGGPDIPPALYGKETLLTTAIEDPVRHYFEISFLAHLIGSSRAPELKPLLDSRPDYLVLGLCLGMQSINVAAGGTLVQDIPSQIYGVKSFEQGLRLSPEKVHRSFRAPLWPAPDLGGGVVHPIKFAAGSELARKLLPDGGAVKVFSIHHQAVGKLGKDLEVLARSLDGKVIEALRHKKYPAVLGVQFHPEKELLWNKAAVYRPASDAPAANYVAEWFLSDPAAQAFVRRFWKLISELAEESGRKGKNIIEGPAVRSPVDNQ